MFRICWCILMRAARHPVPFYVVLNSWKWVSFNAPTRLDISWNLFGSVRSRVAALRHSRYLKLYSSPIFHKTRALQFNTLYHIVSLYYFTIPVIILPQNTLNCLLGVHCPLRLPGIITRVDAGGDVEIAIVVRSE